MSKTLAMREVEVPISEDGWNMEKTVCEIPACECGGEQLVTQWGFVECNTEDPDVEMWRWRVRTVCVDCGKDEGRRIAFVGPSEPVKERNRRLTDKIRRLRAGRDPATGEESHGSTRYRLINGVNVWVKPGQETFTKTINGGVGLMVKEEFVGVLDMANKAAMSLAE
jgi:hypothetical protein